MTISAASLIVRTTKTALYNTAINVASALGLPVSTWQAGDPTRSLYHVEAEMIDALEDLVVNFIKSRFLDEATGEWLKVKAEQDYDVTVPEATYATTDVVLTNTGGGYYPDIEAGDLTFKNSTTDKTYHNTTGGTLASGPGTTLTVTVVADEAGSDSSAAATEIDTMITQLEGVTCSNADAAVGTDEQDEATTRAQCRAKLSALSPNGPAAAYDFVARDPDLAGTSACTRSRTYSDSETGDVTVYCAGPSGGIAEADRALVEDGILTYATPLCITPTVLAASNVAVNVTYQLWIYASVGEVAADIEEAVEAALEDMFAAQPIGGDIITEGGTGYLYQSQIAATIKGVYSQAFRVSVTAPSGDTSLTEGQVATLGTVTPTITLVTDP
jgi:uncharacterized phage protein gp47/JayE